MDRAPPTATSTAPHELLRSTTDTQRASSMHERPFAPVVCFALSLAMPTCAVPQNLISHRRAVIYLILTAVLWSSGGVFIKSISWDGLTTAGMRSLVAGLTLYPIAKRSPVTNFRIVMLGALAYALTLSTFVVATKLTTSANAIVLQYTAPIYVALLSYRFLGEPIDRRDWIAIAFAIVGMFCCFWATLSPTGISGNALALLSGLLFACLILLLRHQRSHHPVQIAYFGNLLAFLLCCPWFDLSMTTSSDLLSVLWLGIIQIALPYFLYTAALTRVTALEAAMIPILEPILNPIWVALVVGEMPGPATIVGGVIVVGAVLYRSIAVRPPLVATEARIS